MIKRFVRWVILWAFNITEAKIAAVVKEYVYVQMKALVETGQLKVENIPKDVTGKRKCYIKHYIVKDWPPQLKSELEQLSMEMEAIKHQMNEEKDQNKKAELSRTLSGKGQRFQALRSSPLTYEVGRVSSHSICDDVQITPEQARAKMGVPKIHETTNEIHLV